VLNLSSDGKVSLVPITILINGKFWDAGAYKASPVPMALEPGTVYEAEKDGSSIGLFTISTALHSNAVNAPVPWLATGAWVPAGTDTEKKTLQAEAAPVGIGDSDVPPRLTKNPAAASSTPGGGTASPGSSPSAPASSTPPPSSGSGDEPPRLTRPAESQSPSSSSAPGSPSTPPQADTKGANQPSSNSSGSTPQSSPQPSASPTPSSEAGKQSDKPGSKAGAKKNDDSSVAASDSGAGEANRPRLRRGKPITSFADEDIPGYSKVGSPSSTTKAGATANAAKTAPSSATVQIIPAISDSAGPDPRSYGFEWLKDEEGERRQQLIALAQEQVRAYIDAKAKATIAPKAVTQKTTARGAHPAAKKSPPATLSNVQMTTFDLWSTNQPIMVFSALAQLPAASAGASSGNSAAPGNLQYSVLLVAYPDIYNNLHKLYVGVTDKFHLDITPQLELVDAVDADGDGRGELLFRETSDAGTGWIIYRATADKLWKIYDSLNPE
jgi:hypothetical protein